MFFLLENNDKSRIMKPKEEIVSIPYQQGVKEKLAVLFDLENLTPDHVLPEIFKEIEKRGFIAHPRKLIFNNIAQIKKGFRDTAVKLYHLDLVGAYAPVGKNVADFCISKRWISFTEGPISKDSASYPAMPTMANSSFVCVTKTDIFWGSVRKKNAKRTTSTFSTILSSLRIFILKLWKRKR